MDLAGAGDACIRAALGDPFQLTFHITGALPSLIRLFGETRFDHVIQRRRQHRLQRRQDRRVVFHDGRNQTRLTLTFERSPPGQHLVDHRTEGEDVRSSVGVFRFELLGSHVLEGPENRALLGERLVRRRQRG